MKQFWKKTLWAALLTAAFALSATGCGDDKQPAGSTANSASSAAQAADSSTAPEETGSSAETNVFQYEMNDDGTVSITGYQGMEAVLEVPSTVDNYVVSAISNHAFEANQNLTEVTLPEGLSEIGESAFMDCGSLTTVQIPETVAVERMFSRIPEKDAVFCNWGCSWWRLRDELLQKMEEEGRYQGRCCDYLNGAALRLLKSE